MYVNIFEETFFHSLRVIVVDIEILLTTIAILIECKTN